MSEEIIQIESKKGIAAISTLGGTTHRFLWNGENIIHPYMDLYGKARGGIPICFPYFGTPPESMKALGRHGWLRDQELKVVKKTRSSLTLRGSNEATEAYPWLLSYEVTAVLDIDGLNLKLFVKRLHDGITVPAPVNFAFHPYFRADLNSQQSCKALVGQEMITEFAAQPQHMLANDRIFVWSGERKVRMHLGGEFSNKSWVVGWSDKPQRYFCVEPILTYPPSFGCEGGRFLSQGGEAAITMTLEVKKD